MQLRLFAIGKGGNRNSDFPLSFFNPQQCNPQSPHSSAEKAYFSLHLQKSKPEHHVSLTEKQENEIANQREIFRILPSRNTKIPCPSRKTPFSIYKNAVFFLKNGVFQLRFRRFSTMKTAFFHHENTVFRHRKG